MSNKIKEVWIPRLFIAAMVPSVLMVLALIFLPSSELAKCPWLVDSGDVMLAQGIQALPGQFVMRIEGASFPVNNLLVISPPVTPGDHLVFLGIVLDVRSGAAFYRADGGYSGLANGRDATRALLLSSLKEEDMSEDLSDQDVSELKPKLKQWLTFFLNKYPQQGVLVGSYWDASGQPTDLLKQLIGVLDSNAGSSEEKRYVMEECVVNNSEVSCKGHILVPKIRRTRGLSKCVCVNENEIFSVQTSDFVIVHFDKCDERGKTCTIAHYELGE